MKMLSRKVLEWRRRTLLANSKKLVEIIHGRITTMYERGYPDMKLIKEQKEKLKKATMQKEEYCRVRLHIDWLKGGDRNLAYFHAYVKGRRKRYLIGSIQSSEGRTIHDQWGIVTAVEDYYEEVFRARSEDIDFGILDGFENRIIDMESSLMDRQFSEEEVFAALQKMHPNKTPGPDGITNKLLQAKWHLFKGDNMHMFLRFHSSCHFESELNEAPIVLIPKVPFPQSVKEYRPISLYNSSYKLIAKVLSNRLKTVLGKLISPFQNDFAARRQILDNVILAHKVLHSIANGRRRSQEVAIEVDIDKAYDKLE
ncbi:hypothetical protein Scep_026108 [Stephania cephalantha]|uniref:Reverse transcriptase domain-containing protein n=1 Tax=Stephania cephalantha TaxID=152367 RepID=A0AAP0EJX9_9MAGN